MGCVRKLDLEEESDRRKASDRIWTSGQLGADLSGSKVGYSISPGSTSSRLTKSQLQNNQSRQELDMVTG